MNSTLTTGGCWPTATQELLLRAALIDGPDAVAAWQEWHSRTDVENLDSGSSRLLPLLYCNLEKQGVELSRLARYKSVSRYYWVQNRLLFERAGHLIQLLEDEGIPTLLLKGSALATLYYPKTSARPMDDSDILVPTAQAMRAFQLLMSNGYLPAQWKRARVPSEREISSRHAHSFSWQSGNSSRVYNFDIHRHIFWDSLADDVDADFWSASTPFELAGVGTRALCAEDSLLHVCAHGAYWNYVPPLRWIADATLILQAHPDMDWERIVAQSRRTNLSIPIRHAFKYLQRLDIGVNIPDAPLRELQRIPTSRAQRREWAVLTRPLASQSVACKLWLRTRAYSRWNATNPVWMRPFTLPRYLQFCWGLDSLAQVLPYGLNAIAETKSSTTAKTLLDGTHSP